MDNFELKSEQKKVNLRPLIWNFLTLMVLLSTCGLAYFFLTIFQDPYSPFNFFPPAPLPTLFQTSTPTSTMIQHPSTWTPTLTAMPSPSRTKAPTWTFLPQMVTPSITSTNSIESTETTPTLIITPMPGSYEITYVASTDFHPDSNCNWMGVAGKVLGTDGQPLPFQEIQMGGSLDGRTISLLTMSGNVSAYGTAGYELLLSDHPIASTQTLWIQLLDNTAKPLTDRIYFDTYDSCTENLVIIDFTKTR
jgi:hypothetical protein